MRNAGWKCCTCDDLGSLYWIHPSASSMRTTDVMRLGTEGIHYFSSEDAIHRYATLHLGWAGKGTSKSSPAKFVVATDRENKKRKQDHALTYDVLSSKKKCEAMLLSAGGGSGDNRGAVDQLNFVSLSSAANGGVLEEEKGRKDRQSQDRRVEGPSVGIPA